MKLYDSELAPNPRRVRIFMAEKGITCDNEQVDIVAGENLTEEFLAINPNNKQPAMIDPDGPDGEPITLWESCAIMIYLAEKSGRFVPGNPAQRAHMMKWLFFQASTQGPMAGQYAHFAFYAAEEHRYPYAIERYQNEINRQMGILDRHLDGRDFMLDDYSIADMALLPYSISMLNRSREPRPHLDAWCDRLCTREPVQKGLAIMKEQVRKETIAGGMEGFGEEHRDILFGDRQFSER